MATEAQMNRLMDRLDRLAEAMGGASRPRLPRNDGDPDDRRGPTHKEAFGAAVTGNIDHKGYGSLGGTTKMVAGAGLAIGGVVQTFQRLQSVLSSISGHISSVSQMFGGQTLTLQSAMKSIIDYSTNMYSLAGAYSKYGVGVGAVQSSMERLRTATGLTRNETMQLMASFESGFNFTGLANGEKLMMNLRKAVGANAEAMKGMMDTLSGLSDKFPELEGAIVNINDAVFGKLNKEKLALQASMLVGSGQMSLSEGKKIGTYINQNAQDGEGGADTKKLGELDATMMAAKHAEQIFEDILMKMGTKVGEWMRIMDEFIQKNKGIFDSLTGTVASVVLVAEVFGLALNGLTGAFSLLKGAFGILTNAFRVGSMLFGGGTAAAAGGAGAAGAAGTAGAAGAAEVGAGAIVAGGAETAVAGVAGAAMATVAALAVVGAAIAVGSTAYALFKEHNEAIQAQIKGAEMSKTLAEQITTSEQLKLAEDKKYIATLNQRIAELRKSAKPEDQKEASALEMKVKDREQIAKLRTQLIQDKQTVASADVKQANTAAGQSMVHGMGGNITHALGEGNAIWGNESSLLTWSGLRDQQPSSQEHEQTGDSAEQQEAKRQAAATQATLHFFEQKQTYYEHRAELLKQGTPKAAQQVLSMDAEMDRDTQTQKLSQMDMSARKKLGKKGDERVTEEDYKKLADDPEFAGRQAMMDEKQKSINKLNIYAGLSSSAPGARTGGAALFDEVAKTDGRRKQEEAESVSLRYQYAMGEDGKYKHGDITGPRSKARAELETLQKQTVGSTVGDNTALGYGLDESQKAALYASDGKGGYDTSKVNASAMSQGVVDSMIQKTGNDIGNVDSEIAKTTAGVKKGGGDDKAVAKATADLVAQKAILEDIQQQWKEQAAAIDSKVGAAQKKVNGYTIEGMQQQKQLKQEIDAANESFQARSALLQAKTQKQVLSGGVDPAANLANAKEASAMYDTLATKQEAWLANQREMAAENEKNAADTVKQADAQIAALTKQLDTASPEKKKEIETGIQAAQIQKDDASRKGTASHSKQQTAMDQIEQLGVERMQKQLEIGENITKAWEGRIQRAQTYLDLVTSISQTRDQLGAGGKEGGENRGKSDDALKARQVEQENKLQSFTARKQLIQDQVTKGVITEAVAKEGVAKLSIEENQAQQEMVSLTRQRLELVRSYTQLNALNLDIARTEVAQQEMFVQLADATGIGVKASADMRFRAVEAMEKEKAVQIDSLRIMKEKEAALKKEVGTKIASGANKKEIDDAQGMYANMQNERKKKENEILQIQMKQLEQTRALRDGYISAIAAMNNGTGIVTKVMADQEHNMGSFLGNTRERVQGLTSGGVGAHAGREESNKLKTRNGSVYLTGPDGANDPYQITAGGSYANGANAMMQGMRKAAMTNNVAGVVHYGNEVGNRVRSSSSAGAAARPDLVSAGLNNDGTNNTQGSEHPPVMTHEIDGKNPNAAPSQVSGANSQINANKDEKPDMLAVVMQMATDVAKIANCIDCSRATSATAGSTPSAAPASTPSAPGSAPATTSAAAKAVQIEVLNQIKKKNELLAANVKQAEIGGNKKEITEAQSLLLNGQNEQKKKEAEIQQMQSEQAGSAPSSTPGTPPVSGSDTNSPASAAPAALAANAAPGAAPSAAPAEGAAGSTGAAAAAIAAANSPEGKLAAVQAQRKEAEANLAEAQKQQAATKMSPDAYKKKHDELVQQREAANKEDKDLGAQWSDSQLAAAKEGGKQDSSPLSTVTNVVNSFNPFNVAQNVSSLASGGGAQKSQNDEAAEQARKLKRQDAQTRAIKLDAEIKEMEAQNAPSTEADQSVEAQKKRVETLRQQEAAAQAEVKANKANPKPAPMTPASIAAAAVKAASAPAASPEALAAGAAPATTGTNPNAAPTTADASGGATPTGGTPPATPAAIAAGTSPATTEGSAAEANAPAEEEMNYEMNDRAEAARSDIKNLAVQAQTADEERSKANPQVKAAYDAHRQAVKQWGKAHPAAPRADGVPEDYSSMAQRASADTTDTTVKGKWDEAEKSYDAMVKKDSRPEQLKQKHDQMVAAWVKDNPLHPDKAPKKETEVARQAMEAAQSAQASSQTEYETKHGEAQAVFDENKIKGTYHKDIRYGVDLNPSITAVDDAQTQAAANRDQATQKADQATITYKAALAQDPVSAQSKSDQASAASDQAQKTYESLKRKADKADKQHRPQAEAAVANAKNDLDKKKAEAAEYSNINKAAKAAKAAPPTGSPAGAVPSAAATVNEAPAGDAPVSDAAKAVNGAAAALPATAQPDATPPVGATPSAGGDASAAPAVNTAQPTGTPNAPPAGSAPATATPAATAANAPAGGAKESQEQGYARAIAGDKNVKALGEAAYALPEGPARQEAFGKFRAEADKYIAGNPSDANKQDAGGAAGGAGAPAPTVHSPYGGSAPMTGSRVGQFGTDTRTGRPITQADMDANDAAATKVNSHQKNNMNVVQYSNDPSMRTANGGLEPNHNQGHPGIHGKGSDKGGSYVNDSASSRTGRTDDHMSYVNTHHEAFVRSLNQHRSTTTNQEYVVKAQHSKQAAEHEQEMEEQRQNIARIRSDPKQRKNETTEQYKARVTGHSNSLTKMMASQEERTGVKIDDRLLNLMTGGKQAGFTPLEGKVQGELGFDREYKGGEGVVGKSGEMVPEAGQRLMMRSGKAGEERVGTVKVGNMTPEMQATWKQSIERHQQGKAEFKTRMEQIHAASASAPKEYTGADGVTHAMKASTPEQVKSHDDFVEKMKGQQPLTHEAVHAGMQTKGQEAQSGSAAGTDATTLNQPAPTSTTTAANTVNGATGAKGATPHTVAAHTVNNPAGHGGKPPEGAAERRDSTMSNVAKLTGASEGGKTTTGSVGAMTFPISVVLGAGSMDALVKKGTEQFASALKSALAQAQTTLSHALSSAQKNANPGSRGTNASTSTGQH